MGLVAAERRERQNEAGPLESPLPAEQVADGVQLLEVSPGLVHTLAEAMTADHLLHEVRPGRKDDAEIHFPMNTKHHKDGTVQRPSCKGACITCLAVCCIVLFLLLFIFEVGGVFADSFTFALLMLVLLWRLSRHSEGYPANLDRWPGAVGCVKSRSLAHAIRIDTTKEEATDENPASSFSSLAPQRSNLTEAQPHLS